MPTERARFLSTVELKVAISKRQKKLSKNMQAKWLFYILTAGLRFHSLKTQVKNLSRLWSSTDELCPVDYFILMLVVSSFGTEQVVRLGLTLCHSGVSAYI